MTSQRSHGSLDSVTDSARRALRPISMGAREVAARTGDLLDSLFALPGVRIFQGVRPNAADLPCVPHVVTAGYQLIFVESVAWPPGRYDMTTTGRIHCDGVYIGQSARPLIAAVHHWREALPDGHRVSALIVVHSIAAGELMLPATTGRTLAWAHSSDAVRDIRARIADEPEMTSIRAVAALAAATAGDEHSKQPSATGLSHAVNSCVHLPVPLQ